LKAANVPVPPPRLDWRTRALIWSAHRFGPGAVLSSMSAMEKRGTQSYVEQGAPGAMVAQEKSHALLMSTISQTARGGLEAAPWRSWRGGIDRRAAMRCARRCWAPAMGCCPT